ncbi:hypothetical protein BJY04DRAFT_187744 [Aspergillus karnatakaensis]|uniref:uncharacterized protein n=1 Tax=Aspergillus karnatakaensis TaxID=1810916 RepID=UPI003CCDB4AA
MKRLNCLMDGQHDRLKRKRTGGPGREACLRVLERPRAEDHLVRRRCIPSGIYTPDLKDNKPPWWHRHLPYLPILVPSWYTLSRYPHYPPKALSLPPSQFDTNLKFFSTKHGTSDLALVQHTYLQDFLFLLIQERYILTSSNPRWSNGHDFRLSPSKEQARETWVRLPVGEDFFFALDSGSRGCFWVHCGGMWSIEGLVGGL